jgi:hypothetical protein
VRQILQIITSRDPKAAHKVLRRRLQVSVTIVHCGELVLGPAEVGVAGDGGCAVELAQTLLGLGLGVGIVSFAAEVLIRGNSLLCAEAGFGLGKFFFCGEY